MSSMTTCLRQRSSLGLESGELSLNMTRGLEASVLNAYLSQAKVEPMFREWIIITEYEKWTRTLKSAAK